MALIEQRLLEIDRAGKLWEKLDACRTVRECEDVLIQALREAAKPGPAFQSRVAPWMTACFPPEVCLDQVERNHRFLEEALELVQARGCSRTHAHQLVDYVFDRPAGDPVQEVGGVMVTLAALCIAGELDMHQAGETELARIWAKIDVIRAKQATKPKHSLPPVIVQAIDDVGGGP